MVTPDQVNAALMAYEASLASQVDPQTSGARILAMLAALEAYEAGRSSLLAKYVAHVVECEGADYIEVGTTYGSESRFTPAEWAELQRIASERRP